MSLPELIKSYIEDVQTQETGFGLAEKLWYGSTSTVLSAVNSIYNTATWYGRWLGLDIQEEKTTDWVRATIGEDAARYYTENQSAFDTAGFLVGAVGLGFGTSMALRAMQAGKWGAGLQRFTGVFSTPKKQIIEEAALDYKRGALSVSAQLSAAKTKAFAYSLGDNAIQSLFAESVIIGAMHQAPIFTDWEIKDFLGNALVGIGLGTGIGGVLDHLRTSKFFKDTMLERAKAVRDFEPFGGLGAGKLFSRGDQITYLVERLDSLPPTLKNDFAKASEVLKEKTIHRTWLEVQKIANDMAGGNPLLGRTLIQTLQKAREAGAAKEDIYNLLAGAHKISGISLDDAFEKEIFYLAELPQKLRGAPKITIDQAISSTPISGNKLNLPYQIAKGETPTIKFIGVDGIKSVSDGFSEGADIVIDSLGYPHVNRNSTKITRAPFPGEQTVFSKKVEEFRAEYGVLPEEALAELRLADVIVDLKTGEITETAYATLGDLYASGSKTASTKLEVTKDGKLFFGPGNKVADFVDPGYWATLSLEKQDKNYWFNLHSRWGLAQLWKELPKHIHATDLPFLVAKIRQLKQVPNLDTFRMLVGETSVTTVEGNLVKLNSVKDPFAFLYSQLEYSFKKHVDTLLQEGVSIHEMQRILNYPVDLLKQMDIKKETLIKHLVENLDDVTVPHYAKISYAANTIVDNQGMYLRGLMAVHERIKIQREANNDAFAFYAKKLADNFFPLDPDFVRKNAIPTQTAAGFITHAEADYSLKGMLMQIGNLTSKLRNEKLTARAKDLAFGGGNALLDNPKATAEASLILHAVQRAPGRYVLFSHTDDVTGTKVSGIIDSRLAPLLDDPTLPKTTLFNELEQSDIFQHILKNEGYATTGEGFRPWILFETPEAARFITTWHNITAEIAEEVNLFRKTQGLASVLNPAHLYAPPPDLKKFPYVAFIRAKQGGIGKTGMVGAVTARTSKEFTQKLAKIDQNQFDIITKGESKAWHEALGDFEYNQMINDPETDMFLKREGLLSEFYPNLSGHDLISRLEDYMAKQTTVLTRNYVGLKYSQEIEELLALSNQHVELAVSSARKYTKAAEMAVEDPYLQHIKLMLNMSSINEHPLWFAANEKVNAFLGPAFNKVRELFHKAADNVISFDEANDMAERMGLGRVYEKVAEGLDIHQVYKEANGMSYDPQIVTRFVTKMNNILVNLVLRLDHANALINSISMPILMVPEVKSILRHIKDPAVTGQLGEALSYKVANTNLTIPSATKLYFKAVQRLLDPKTGPTLRDYYEQIGIVRPTIKEYYNLIDDMAIRGNETMSKLEELGNKIVDKAAKVFLTDASEQMNRMISADVMKQITEIAGIDDRLASAYINTFVNRVNGNFLASQRPILFQGPVGQALGLFQSYQFNLLQNVFRHFMNRDKAAIAMLTGLQSSLYGVQSLPAFQAANVHLIGNAFGNKEHRDVYSYLPTLLPEDVAETILYGGIGWFTDTALYTRGDINPRQVTIVPVNPLDWPAISAFSRVVSNLYNFGENLVKGAGLGNSILMALEHNGLSRPLTGLIQTLQGFATTSKGGLISAHQDLLSIATVSRLIGSKPLNDAIAMDASYRMVAYIAHDKELRNALSRVIRAKLLRGEEITAEDWENFTFQYAKAGGTMQGYNRFIANIIKTYNEPVANKFLRNLNTPYNRRMWEIMNGEPLEAIDLMEGAGNA